MNHSNFRIEEDLIGKKQIEENSYYGIQTLRAIENFPITGYRLHPELIRSIAMVKKAAALANHETGLLPTEKANAIVQAAEEVIEGKWHDQFLVDPIQGGAGTSINMNANEVLANRALELLGRNKGDYAFISPTSHVNMSQSTNDAFPCAIHIATLRLIDQLHETLASLCKEFHRKAAEFNGILKMGRTHLQDAVPIRLDQEWDAYALVLERDMKRIENTKDNLYSINLGATAVGTGLNANTKYINHAVYLLSQMSGYPFIKAKSLVDATQNTDCYTEVSAALKICMINMSKIANDFRLLASGPKVGLNELHLPARQAGSSIMPGKVNPVMPEVINQVAFQVIGNDHTISMASEAGQLELNVMEPVLVFNLFQSLSIMNNCFSVFRDYCVVGVTPNIERMKEYVDSSIGIITAINPYIGYEKATEVAREALRSNRSVREICLEKGFLSEEKLDIILNPFHMTSPQETEPELKNGDSLHCGVLNSV
ncbi:aspartate ammonia-lyase [Sporosarcina sp. 179-K 8C2 HS]|uniref:aspartate ammonia-lyase n=1 Tax=Sporosarcina sp. 179-K 8C2 HS TaxID=3142387 RepID=UPI00399F6A57